MASGEPLLAELVKRALSDSVRKNETEALNLWVAFERRLEDHFYNVKAKSLAEMRKNHGARNKNKGDLFEFFCLQLLLLPREIRPFTQSSLKSIDEGWLLRDLPSEHRETLCLKKRDMGIDIIARTIDNQWIAIQCKYRKKPDKQRYYPLQEGSNKRYPIPYRVTFKDLSTFNSLAKSTGPKKGWCRRVVMTNCDSINRQGRKEHEDLSICRRTLLSLGREVWNALAGDLGRTLSDPPEVDYFSKDQSSSSSSSTLMDTKPKPKKIRTDAEKARQKRQAWLDKLVAKTDE